MKINDPVTFIFAATEADDKLVKEHHPEAEHAGRPEGGDGCWLVTIPGLVWDLVTEQGEAEWCSVPGIVWYIAETR